MLGEMITGTIVLMVICTLAVLRAMGRSWGEPRVWTSDANSSSTSQRLADPYTFTHMLHGIAFFLAMSFFDMSFGAKLLAATALECGWEILENTQTVIGRYRAETVSLGYNGDSVLNSLGDIVAMGVGFKVASVAPWQVSLAIFAVTELTLAVLIRDNLTLNVVQLVAPSKKIKAWQQRTS